MLGKRFFDPVRFFQSSSYFIFYGPNVFFLTKADKCNVWGHFDHIKHLIIFKMNFLACYCHCKILNAFGRAFVIFFNTIVVYCKFVVFVYFRTVLYIFRCFP